MTPSPQTPAPGAEAPGHEALGTGAGAPVPDPYSPEFMTDPYPTLDVLRAHQPVCPVKTPFLGDAWLVSRYDSVRATLADPRMGRRDPEDPEDGPASLDSDPPDHTRLRRLLQKTFTHRRIQLLRPRVQELVDSMVDAFADRGGAELLDELAYPLPIAVICEMLGVPESDWAEVRSRTAKFIDGEIPQNRFEAYVATHEYIVGLVAAKREQPGDDLVSALLAARDGEQRLTEEELVNLLVMMVVAGFITTTNLIGNGVHALLTNPDQLRLLIEKPELIDSAVEEFLRYESSFSVVSVIPQEDVEIDGVLVAKGEKVLASCHGANRDPERFTDPELLDITRSPNPHIAFGHGAHHCFGAPLARLEAQLAIGTVVRRLAGLRLDGEAAWRGGVLRGLHTLPVAFDGDAGSGS
ncbi:cytochrome P450 (plasmid) [Streptomyces sp. NBC_00435]|uniref:cytochrome P450 family protein n=1 Tax=Streptomyces sp. NBC_00435 TaxID=2903649 RepID=UPI002E1CE012